MTDTLSVSMIIRVPESTAVKKTDTPSFTINNDFAFTLLEILVAVMIFGIIMLTVFSSFRSFMVSAQMIKNSMIASRICSVISSVMERDFLSLRIALPPEYSKSVSGSTDYDDKDSFRFTGDETTDRGNIFSRVRFTSLFHIDFGNYGNQRAGAARIVYYVRFNPEYGFDLCRSDTLNIFDQTEGNECDPVICKDITQFKVTYMDVEGEEHSYWDSESDEFGYATPVSLLIDIEFKAGESLHRFSTSISMPLFRAAVK